MGMFRFLCCFINWTKIKPSSPPQVVETGKNISPSPPPQLPQVTEKAKKEPPQQPSRPGVVKLRKGITVKDGGLVVSKSSKTTTKSSRRHTRYGNTAGGSGGCGGGCGGGGC
ncbi:hypothetical protein ISN45_Aa01g038440 [Arabidopsis thaliana x Arabidopsis arenosa]|uniref:Uncharacterized protein n=1 Tax=Arabidopsis thaliana x Arabidopsis arenosa TaxID=1240361 RepID=A0A8T2CA10_9BRAS|nr:hypothetical protein ISN45_Aa01g038440 [Arabidopsis thaliana x Arabidopsis arenosa]